MKSLFLTTPKEDYLQDKLLIGLRKLMNKNCVDYPQEDVLYEDYRESEKDLYGRGFTIWKTLKSININRKKVTKKIKSGIFDVVIFGSIWRQKETFHKFEKKSLFSSGNGTKFVFIDGEDIPQAKEGAFQRTIKKLKNISKSRVKISAKFLTPK